MALLIRDAIYARKGIGSRVEPKRAQSAKLAPTLGLRARLSVKNALQANSLPRGPRRAPHAKLAPLAALAEVSVKSVTPVNIVVKDLRRANPVLAAVTHLEEHLGVLTVLLGSLQTPPVKESAMNVCQALTQEMRAQLSALVVQVAKSARCLEQVSVLGVPKASTARVPRNASSVSQENSPIATQIVNASVVKLAPIAVRVRAHALHAKLAPIAM